MRRPHWLAGSLLLLACSSPHDNVLFAPDDPAQGGSASVGGASGSGGSETAPAQSGTDSGSSASGSTGGYGGSVAGQLAGSAGALAGGGSGSGGNGGSAGGDAPPTPLVESCDMVEGSVVASFNGHCYRVNVAELDFHAASAACEADGGHLITIASKQENDFTRDLHDGEHWLGATDQRGDEVPGVGTYVWVTGEPWDYSDWEDGQPNALETDCPGDDDADCYEHCGYQTDEGDWIDRSCWHTIVSICEWDVESSVDDTNGLAGAAGGPG